MTARQDAEGRCTACGGRSAASSAGGIYWCCDELRRALYTWPDHTPKPAADEPVIRIQIDPPIPYEVDSYDFYPIGTDPFPQRIYDIPQDQYSRWLSARAAWQAVEEEMGALIRDPSRQELNTPAAQAAWRDRRGNRT